MNGLEYKLIYEEIYDSSYGTSFVFIEEDELFVEDIDLYSPICPLAPSGFCKSNNIGSA